MTNARKHLTETDRLNALIHLGEPSLHAATLAVCSRAADVAEAREVLEMVGLVEVKG